MRQKCVCCVARSAPPSQFMMSVRSTIVLNLLTPTLVGPMLLSTIQMTVGVAAFTDIALLCNVLCREGVQCNVVYLGSSRELETVAEGFRRRYRVVTEMAEDCRRSWR